MHPCTVCDCTYSKPVPKHHLFSGTGTHRFFAATGLNMAGLCSNVMQDSSSRYFGTGLCQYVQSAGHHIAMPRGAEGTLPSI